MHIPGGSVTIIAVLSAYSVLVIVISAYLFRFKRNSNSKEPFVNKIRATKELLDFLDSFITDICIKEINDFKDTHDLSKSNKTTMAELVSDTAYKIKNFLNEDLFDKFSIIGDITNQHTLLSDNFLNTYIIDTTSFIMKRLMKKVIDDFDAVEADQ